MKTLHVVASLSLRHGGVSASVRELARALAKARVQVEVFTTLRGYDPSIDQPADDSLRSTGGAVRYFPVHPWKPLGSRYAYSPPLREALRSSLSSFDLVHIHGLWLHTTFIAARTCQRFRIPYLVSPCGALDPYGWRRHRLFKQVYGRFIERETLKKAAAIHFTSFLEQHRARTFGIHRPSVVIPRSFSMETLVPPSPGTFRQRHPEIGDRKILLFLGRLHPKKRLDLVGRAFCLLAGKFNDVHLVVAGPDEGAATQVRAILDQAGLLPRATFPGLLTGAEKWAAFQDASLFLLPSEDENFGVAALEALAMGLPVLVSPQVGIGEWLLQAQAGRVVELREEAWAQAVENLLRHPDLAQAMAQAGRRLATSSFSSERVGAEMKEVYTRLIQSGNGGAG